MPETIEQLRAENAKLRAENQRLGGATTMMGCKACGHGVRPRYAVHGMCADCAAKRITELETLLADERLGLQEFHIERGPDGRPLAEFVCEGTAVRRVVEALCYHFIGSGADNFLETQILFKPALNHSAPEVKQVGEFTMTLQRREGKTPGQALNECKRKLALAAKRITELETVAEAVEAWNVKRELAEAVCGKVRTDEDDADCERLLIEAERALSAVVALLEPEVLKP